MTAYPMDRRAFLRSFGSMVGCFTVTASLPFRPMPLDAREASRYGFPQGIASGDPTSRSVILWTRVGSTTGNRGPVTARVQVAPARDFQTVVALPRSGGIRQ